MRDAIWRDLRDSWRRMRRSPGASFVVVASLGVAMAASATVFSFVNVLMLRTLSVPNPQRLVSVDSVDPKTTQPTGFYGDAFAAFQASQTSFTALSMPSPSLYRVSARGVTSDVAADGVTSGYRGVVGLRMIAGRFVSGGEQPVRPGDPPHEAVISERLWARVFGSDSRAVGERIAVDGIEVAIVGIAAASPDGLDPETLTDLYLPSSVTRLIAGDASPQVRARNLVGRLADGVTIEQARAEVLGRWPGIQASTMATLPASVQRTLRSPQLQMDSLARGFSSLRRQYGQALVVLAGLTLLLLAVACVNVAGLATAHAAARQHEFAVRLALGAGKWGIARTLLVDGVVLSLCSAVAALPLVWWATSWLTAAVSVARAFPLARPMTPDARVLAAIVAVAIVVGVLSGALPAWRAVTGRAADVSRGGRTSTRGAMASARVALATQVALSLVLLVGASLFVGSLAGLHSNHAMLGAGPILWTRLALNPADRGTSVTKDYYQALTQDLANIPGVDSAVLSSFFPAYLGYVGSLPVDRYASTTQGSATSTASGLTEFVSPGFFETFGIAQIRGRDFTWADDGTTPQVAIVSESLAGQLFPGGHAVGQHMRIEAGTGDTQLEIIGVVTDAPIGSVRDPHVAVAFRPMAQDLTRARFPLAHVRVTGDMSSVRDGYVRAVEAKGHHFARGLFTFQEWTDYALLRERLIAGLSAAAAALAVVLACLGLYGLLAFSVATRVREIGVRAALGATRTRIVAMVVRDGLSMVVPGVLVGVPVALVAAQLVRSQLYGVAPDDPRTIAWASAAFLATALVAAFVPSLRAARVEPAEALRHE